MQRLKAHIFLVILALLCVVLGAVYYGKKTLGREAAGRFVPNASPESILAGLRWYAEHSVGSLQPPLKLFFTLASAEERSSALTSTPFWPESQLREIGVLAPLASEALNGLGAERLNNCPLFSAGLRAFIWPVPGERGKGHFFFSPLSFEVLGLDSAKLSKSPEGLQQLEVMFTWKTTAISPIFRAFQQAKTARPLPADWAEDKWQSLLSKEMKQKVNFTWNEYGYYLPINQCVPSSKGAR